MPLTADAVRAAVSAYYAAIRAGDIDAILKLFAPDAVMRDPVGSPAATDDDSRRLRYTPLTSLFDSFTIEPQNVIAGGNEAAAAWQARAVAKNGRDVAFNGISTFTFADDGRIAAMSAFWDSASIVAAMSA